MIFQFQKNDVTFTIEDQEYFEAKLSTITKFLGNEAGDEDSVKAHVSLEKDKHHSGNRFHAKGHITAPHGGDFFTEVEAPTIRALADKLEDTLDRQARKFHQKHLSK